MNKYFIDLHCHTIASKAASGESKQRNVPNKDFFLERMKDSHVSLVAITNHNHFNRIQYEEFKANDVVLVLPGIELDIELLNGGVGHLLFVSSDAEDKYNLFLAFVNEIGADDIGNACNLRIKLTDLPALISKLDGLIIVHYGGKAAQFTDNDVEFLKTNCSQNLFVEPSSLISAFIYVNKGIRSIVGSDVKDWNDYPGKDLPELKVRIEDFSKLKLLLQKDENLIADKTKAKLFNPQFKIINSEYAINETVALYYDCNVIMGPKSSGKSIFLEAIKNELVKEGYQGNTRCYFADKVSEKYKKLVEYKPSETELNEFARTNNLYKNEIKGIKEFSFPKIEPVLKQIREFIESSSKTRLASQLGFVSSRTFFSSVSPTYENDKAQMMADYAKITAFKKNKRYEPYMPKCQTTLMDSLLEKAAANILNRFKEIFVSLNSITLSNNCINGFKQIFTQLKSCAAMPNTTGLRAIYDKEKDFIAKCAFINDVLNSKEKRCETFTGYLEGKGKVKLVNEISSALAYSQESNPIKLFKAKFATKARDIKDEIKKLLAKPFNKDTSKQIGIIAKLLDENNVKAISDFLGYQSFFLRSNGNKFSPSKGEQAILVLSDCLYDDNPKIQFYLLDEPEMSVGHHYVNDTIVPRIKDLCRLGKCVVVCTHDANIGVGTLPFQVIYREEDEEEHYHTYTGNPFHGVLIDQYQNMKNWKETAVSILEGGREALDLREVTYGDKD